MLQGRSRIGRTQHNDSSSTWNPTTPCSQITLKLVKDVFRSLRNHENRWGEKFSPDHSTEGFQEPTSTVPRPVGKQGHHREPNRQVSFQDREMGTSKTNVPPVSDEVFLKVLREAFIQEGTATEDFVCLLQDHVSKTERSTILSRGRSRWRSLGRRRPKEKDGQSLERQTQSETRLSTCAAWYVEAVDDLERSGHCQRRSSGWANLSLAE